MHPILKLTHAIEQDNKESPLVDFLLESARTLTSMGIDSSKFQEKTLQEVFEKTCLYVLVLTLNHHKDAFITFFPESRLRIRATVLVTFLYWESLRRFIVGYQINSLSISADKTLNLMMTSLTIHLKDDSEKSLIFNGDYDDLPEILDKFIDSVGFDRNLNFMIIGLLKFSKLEQSLIPFINEEKRFNSHISTLMLSLSNDEILYF